MPAKDTAPTSNMVTQPRTRPKPGERRAQILQTLAAMLEQPGGERITTAALAARLDVSEAALYRHFASKAQMFEGLIDFIESTVFGLARQLDEREPVPLARCLKLVTLLLQFAEKNPGMARVMVGDALVLEHERLQQRMNLFFDKFEAQLKQCLRQSAATAQPVDGGLATAPADNTPDAHAQARAALLTAFCMGQLQRYVRSGFKRMPTERLSQRLVLVLN